MNLTKNAKFGLQVGLVAGVLIIGLIVKMVAGAHQPEPRAAVYARTDNARVQSSDGVDSGVFIKLHDNSPKDKPDTAWTLWLYKYDGAEYLFVFSNNQIQFVKHK